MESATQPFQSEREVELRFEAMIRQKLVEMITDLGPELEGVFKHAKWAPAYRATLRDYLTINPILTNADRLATDASLYGRRHGPELVQELIRLAACLGNGDRPTAKHEGRLSFVIKATRAGKPVRIETRMELDLDRAGKPTHHYVTLIFISDRRADEAALAHLAALSDA